jgi:hypothetical protein
MQHTEAILELWKCYSLQDAASQTEGVDEQLVDVLFEAFVHLFALVETSEWVRDVRLKIVQTGRRVCAAVFGLKCGLGLQCADVLVSFPVSFLALAAAVHCFLAFGALFERVDVGC